MPAETYTAKDAADANVDFAVDQVGSLKYPYVKLAVGADGTATEVTDIATGAAQATGNASLANIDSDIGAPGTSGSTAADAAAADGSGVVTVISGVRRLIVAVATSLTNWTTLLARIPALVGGRVPVDGSAVTQPVSATSLPLPTGAATDRTTAAAPNAARLSDGSAFYDARSIRALTSADQVTIAALPATAATSANQTTTNTSLASIDGKVPALVSGRTPVQSSLPVGGAGVILNATTAAGGTTFVTFASQSCTSLDVQNITGVTIEVQRGGAGSTFRIPSPGARIFYGITNANQIGVRRLDQSTSQVTVDAEALS